MIFVHLPPGPESWPGTLVERRALDPAEPIPAGSRWIDLVSPTREEDAKVERFLGIEVPTREDQADIEPSEILYAEHGARYLTARLLCRADEAEPILTAVSFIV